MQVRLRISRSSSYIEVMRSRSRVSVSYSLVVCLGNLVLTLTLRSLCVMSCLAAPLSRAFLTVAVSLSLTKLFTMPRMQHVRKRNKLERALCVRLCTVYSQHAVSRYSCSLHNGLNCVDVPRCTVMLHVRTTATLHTDWLLANKACSVVTEVCCVFCVQHQQKNSCSTALFTGVL